MVELLALWALLLFADKKGFHLQVLGDSKVIVDSVNDKGGLNGCTLEYWCRRICCEQTHFSEITSEHVYREFKKVVDILSKKALSVLEGILFFEKQKR